MKKCPICNDEVSCKKWRYGTKMCSKCDGCMRSKKKKLALKNKVVKK